VVARQHTQRHQNFNAPLLLRRLYRGHGVAISRNNSSIFFISILFLAEPLAEESIQKKEKAEKVNFYLRHNF
jgi:hypothetical protein